ncbi:MAG TPA: hypothetical protein VKU44_09830 [Terriglobia bacterium]|nr:hypothetical protein [Terriglobia bacterium]
MRVAKTFTVDDALLAYVAKTRRGRSTSQRVNELLQSAIKAERYQQLEAEAADFFSEPRPSSRASRAERTEARAFQRASARSIARD